MRSSVFLPLVLLVLLPGCGPRAWLPVLHSMRAKTITMVMLNNEGDDYNSKAPPGFVPAKENKWVIFFYEPAVDPKVHTAFMGLARDCFMSELPGDEDEAP
ncbi:MAG: hypothetical protein ACYC8T_20035, partial [Myxococcaceae bacterium]